MQTICYICVNQRVNYIKPYTAMTASNHSTRSTDHKEGKATVRIVYFKQKTYADGSHPFMLCVTKDRQRRYAATGITLQPSYWNFEKDTYRKNLSQEKREEIELHLQTWLDTYNSAAQELAEADEEHTAETVMERVTTNRKTLRQFKLIGYFDHLIDQFESIDKLGNRKVYRDVQNNLKRYLGSSEDISFNNVDVKFCNGWEHFMKSKGLNEVTISLKFRTLRTVFNKAIADGYAKSEHYPFARNISEKHKFQVGKFSTKTIKRSISKSDIAKIQSFVPEKYCGKYATLRDNSTRLLLARNIFMFSYYCGGINFVDIGLLKWSNIELNLYGDKRLKYTRKKTNGNFDIKLLPQALEIIEHYKQTNKNQVQDYIFPILNKQIHKNAKQIHNRINKVMTQINSDLKLISEAVGLNTKLTTYVARHTFATSLRTSGQEISVISQAMGHSDEATTRIYLKELGTELIDSAYNNL